MLIVEEFKQKKTLEEILWALKDEAYLFCLDSSLLDPKRGRYTFIGCDPFDTYQGKGVASFEDLKGKFQRYQHTHYDDFSPFASGMVGAISYDYGLSQERIVSQAIDDGQLPDCFFGFYDCVIALDHLEGKIFISSTGLGFPGNSDRKTHAQNRLDYFVAMLEKHNPMTLENDQEVSEELPLTSNFTKEKYIQSVKEVLRFIEEGEIYQVNLSQRFSYNHDAPIDHVAMYLNLRKNFPTHFSGYLNAGSFQILSSSPERFLQRRKNVVQTQPMKGTRPRSAQRDQDQAYREELEANEKEKAELLMVTDLERNDLGRVCEYGSVVVDQMRAIESYKSVYQAISTITGTLQSDKTSFDVLDATFPGGSITGCPKIRAMQVIDQLEPTRRSFYTGAFGYMNFNGDMDFNILIRTLLIQDKKVSFQVGGGIVADSLPEKEYEETLLKAQAMLKTIQTSLQQSSFSS